MSEHKIHAMDPKRTTILATKIYQLLNKEKDFSIYEKYASGIIYSRMISAYNNETKEEFITNVTSLIEHMPTKDELEHG